MKETWTSGRSPQTLTLTISSPSSSRSVDVRSRPVMWTLVVPTTEEGSGSVSPVFPLLRVPGA